MFNFTTGYLPKSEHNLAGEYPEPNAVFGKPVRRRGKRDDTATMVGGESCEVKKIFVGIEKRVVPCCFIKIILSVMKLKPLKLRAAMKKVFLGAKNLVHRLMNADRRIKLIFVCFILLGYFLLKFFEINDNSLRHTFISFDFGERYYVSELSVEIRNKDVTKGKDLAQISGRINYRNIAKPDSTFQIYVDKQWKFLDSNYPIKGMYRNEDVTIYTFKVNEEDASFFINFEGGIFSVKNQEINNNFYMYITIRDSLTLFPKSSFKITGLYNYNLSNVYPDSDVKKENVSTLVFDYEISDKSEKTIFRSNGFWISGEHKQRKYKNQNLIFILGLVIGALFSGIIELAISFLKDEK